MGTQQNGNYQQQKTKQCVLIRLSLIAVLPLDHMVRGSQTQSLVDAFWTRSRARTTHDTQESWLDLRYVYHPISFLTAVIHI